MLTFFFTIVFIAEVVIVAHIIAFIMKCDKKVSSLNKTLISYKPSIENSFISLRITLNTALLNINKAKIKIAEKKDEYKTLILKNIITAVLFILLNTNGKKIITAVELMFSVKDFVKTSLKAINNLKK